MNSSSTIAVQTAALALIELSVSTLPRSYSEIQALDEAEAQARVVIWREESAPTYAQVSRWRELGGLWSAATLLLAMTNA